MNKIAIIKSDFNLKITNSLLQSILKSSKEHKSIKLAIYNVPGSIELIFAAKQVILTDKFDAIIILGCVIKGITDHYYYVCKQVSEGTQKLILNYNIPIIFGVLTTNNIEEAIKRSDCNQLDYGQYFFNAALSLISLKKNILNNHLQ